MKLNNIKYIIKKELDKIFKFPRMLFSTIIFPGLLIFGIYSVMGIISSAEIEKTEEHVSQILIVNLPSDLKQIFNTQELISYQEIDGNTVDDAKQQVTDEVIDVLIVFDENFSNKVETNEKPLISIYYNSISNNSTISYSRVMTSIEMYRLAKLSEFQIDAQLFTQQTTELYEEKKATGTLLAMMLPMMIMIAIFASCLGVGADTIAGEKERGTLSTLLMLPISKTEIIVGKILSTSIITICGAVSSFIGILASLPFGATLYGIEGEVNYTFIDYAYMAVILLLVAIFASVMMLLISTFARNVKEATAYGMPLYIIAALSSMIVSFGADVNKASYLIPVYNCSLGLRDIFSYSLNIDNFILIIVSSIVCIILVVFVLLKMFKNERLLFGK